MRQDIAKKSKKWLKVLKYNDFRVPYQILIDNSFINIANKHNIKFSTIKDLFKSEPKLLMTKCVYELNKSHTLPNDFSGQCEITQCTHDKPDKNCTASFIKAGNPHHYIYATNNIFIIKSLKTSTDTPILRIFQNQLVIECNKMDQSPKTHNGNPASKKELKTLRKMFE